MSCPRIPVIPRISRTVENVYVVNRGQTAPGLLNLINDPKAFLRFQRDGGQDRSRPGVPWKTEGQYQL